MTEYPLEVNTRQLILDEAKALFYEKGYDNTSMRDLAKATNLSVAGIYYHFPDKEELLFTVMTDGIRKLNDMIRAAFVPGRDPEENLRAGILTLVRHSVSCRDEMDILSREAIRLSREHTEKYFATRDEARELVTGELIRYVEANGIRDADPLYASYTVFSQTGWFAQWFWNEENEELEAFADKIFAMTVYALTAAGRGAGGKR